MSDELFGGWIVRSYTNRGGRHQEWFAWRARARDVDGADVGQVLLESRPFADAAKLGPALIYKRDLGVRRDSWLREYFAGNNILASDNRDRAQLANDQTIEWSTPEMYAASFEWTYSPERQREVFGPPDPVWDRTSSRGLQWYGVRTIAIQASNAFELISWIGVRPGTGDPETTQLVLNNLEEAGFEPVAGLAEIYDTHYLRPQEGMVMFQIRRTRSKMSSEEYLGRYWRLD
jgi:hypothetical protein